MHPTNMSDLAATIVADRHREAAAARAAAAVAPRHASRRRWTVRWRRDAVAPAGSGELSPAARR